MNTCEIHIDSSQSKVAINHALTSIKEELTADWVVVNYIQGIWDKSEYIILIDSEDELTFEKDVSYSKIKVSAIYINWETKRAVRIYKSLIKKILINDIEI